MIDSYLAPEDLGSARQRLQEALQARRRSGSGPASGRQAPSEAEGTVVSLGRGSFAAQRGGLPHDATFVLADMVLWRWDEDSLLALADWLQPGMVLFFLEPTAELGWRRALHRLARLPIRLLLRHHFEADVPASLRAAGLVVTTVDRFSVGSAGWRSYVWGAAEHISPIATH